MNRSLVVALCAVVLPAAAQYKWTDADGRVGYGDSPPREARNIQRIDVRGDDGGDELLRGLPYALRRVAEQHPVVLYTTAPCAPCEAARELLRARGVPYVERTVTSNDDIGELQRIAGTDRLPVLAVGRQFERSFETGAWNALLDLAGYPRASLLTRTWRPPAPQPLAPRPAPQPAPQAATTPSN
ncbi:MAG: glutaredoxin family protein [Pseudomonadota bacterium]